MNLESRYSQLPERLYVAAQPVPAPAPMLFAWNRALAEQLGLDQLGDAQALAQIFSGNRPLDGARPIALAYAGHQFGQFVPQLGDGRAVLLGEARDRQGRVFDIQLKGSGRTAFSRAGDGRSSLGPVVREYLLSEAMHALGVPTTRALAGVSTGEKVVRGAAEPGGVFTRVASSHIRIGSFQYFAARGDLEALRALADLAIERHYPAATDQAQPYLALFAGVVERQAVLVAHWMDIGFIHGVMNTDNTTVSGETLDYGPCAFMDEYHADKVFSSIDHGGRYAFSNQPTIAHWNLARLAECLLLLDEDLAAFQAQLDRLPGLFDEQYHARMRRKLGLATQEPGDIALVSEWLNHLQTEQLDYTLGFRDLAAQLDAAAAPRFGDFELRWKQRLAAEGTLPAAAMARMNAVNPLFIPRNHQVERAIQAAFQDDYGPFNELLQVLARPFDEQPEAAAYAAPPTPEQRVTRTFCGT